MIIVKIDCSIISVAVNSTNDCCGTICAAIRIINVYTVLINVFQIIMQLYTVTSVVLQFKCTLFADRPYYSIFQCCIGQSDKQIQASKTFKDGKQILHVTTLRVCVCHRARKWTILAEHFLSRSGKDLPKKKEEVEPSSSSCVLLFFLHHLFITPTLPHSGDCLLSIPICQVGNENKRGRIKQIEDK